MRDDRGLEAVRGVSFEVRAGEIVGIAGVDGNGQTRAHRGDRGHAQARRGPRSGSAAEDVDRATRRGECLDAGVGHIPEDRQRRGLVLDFTLAENIALHDYREPPDSRYGWLFPEQLIARARAAAQGVRRARRRARRRAPRRSRAATSRRSIAGARDLLATRACSSLRSRRAASTSARSSSCTAAWSSSATRGAAMLLVSFELDEILSLADRILVIYEGQIVAEYAPDVSEEELGLAMTGGASGRRPRERDARRRLPARSRARATIAGRLGTRRSPAGSSRRSLRPSSRSSSAASSSSRPGTTRSSPTRRSSRHRPQLVLQFPGSRATERPSSAARQPQQTLIITTPLDAHRARRRVRVPLRHVQHRRPGPVLGRARSRRLARRPLRRACPARCTSSSRRRRRSLGGRASGRHRRAPQGDRGAHEVISTIMLNWIAI